MESKADALVLRATDYGEYDKMVTLLTAERGKIGAALKGVRRAGAKLKFAAQPFCFAEYVFASRGGRNTVTSAALHDGFYALREDVTRYYAGAVVLSACDKIALEGMESGELLIAAVTALEEIAQDEPLALVRFLAAFRRRNAPCAAEFRRAECASIFRAERSFARAVRRRAFPRARAPTAPCAP